MKALVLAAAILCLIAASALAIVVPSVPRMIPYQGRLTDAGGNPLTGAYLVRFQIYNAPAAGITLWDNGFRKINVAAGLFTYNLGDSTVLPYSIFTSDTNVWLGITVGADPEISPRTKLNSVPYAYKASTADTAGYSRFAGSAFDEAGFAASNTTGSVLISTVDTTLNFVTFSPPANGYVLVISEAEFNAATAGTYLGCSMVRNGSYTLEFFDWDPGDVDGWFDLTQTKVSTDTVTAGNLYTYALHAHMNVGTATAFNARVIVVFFPKRYDVLIKPFSGNGGISAGLNNLLGAAGLRPNETAGVRTPRPAGGGESGRRNSDRSRRQREANWTPGLGGLRQKFSRRPDQPTIPGNELREASCPPHSELISERKVERKRT